MTEPTSAGIIKTACRWMLRAATLTIVSPPKFLMDLSMPGAQWYFVYDPPESFRQIRSGTACYYGPIEMDYDADSFNATVRVTDAFHLTRGQRTELKHRIPGLQISRIPAKRKDPASGKDVPYLYAYDFNLTNEADSDNDEDDTSIADQAASKEKYHQAIRKLVKFLYHEE